MNKLPNVAILLTTFNSEKYLEQQLQSLVNQKFVKVNIYISDDNSQDKTLKLLNLFSKKNKGVIKKIYQVNFKDPNKNFLNLIKKVPKYDFYAMADHDDVWLSDKLIRALKILKKGYILYGSRVKAVDKDLNFIGYSPKFKKKPSFKNALVQALFANCTAVFTYEMLDLFRSYKIDFNKKFKTDPSWLLYLLATFHGKKVFYDKTPKILYRQHENNVMGLGSSYLHKLRSLYYFFSGVNKKMNDMHIKFLKNIKSNQPKENIKVLELFDNLRKKMNFFKFNNMLLKKSGVYRQTKKGNILLKIGLILNLE